MQSNNPQFWVTNVLKMDRGSKDQVAKVCQIL
jgi:hypothetical protein